MTILDTIIEYKKGEVAQAKALKSIAELKQMPHFSKPALSLKQFLLDETKTGIIAEYKRQSPSKGIINATATVAEVTTSYSQNGASGISVLTDNHFFGGNLDDLLAATINEVPLLRKDFMIDEYQLVEAKAYGASVILLIAACLSPERVKELAIEAKNIGLEVLLEIHHAEELLHICEEIDMVGVNNRNLKDFKVNVEASAQLIKEIPTNKIAVAESGISNTDTIVFLRDVGFKGFLIGEHFMKQPKPAIAFADFVADLKLKQ
ncbi:indole-3-glycerol phosphate synthase TrpC [Parasediminibacterium sp. JCM 36343]|uniref:indole-3-glycerol phosphate synthase TrpC n=1 Tax=Parasediminibacterium sp. JCM 36343 TaxID=3374279 RepID=UPI00397DDA23